MLFAKTTLTAILLCLCVASRAQTDFRTLIRKADSTAFSGAYASALDSYNQALALPIPPAANLATIHYNMACAYALTGNKGMAISSLKQSFGWAEKTGTWPVSAHHILRDTDLDALRDDERFERLLYRYYSRDVIDFARSPEVSYDALLKFLAADRTKGTLLVRDKTIYWTDGAVLNGKHERIPWLECNPSVDALVFLNCTFKVNLIWFDPADDMAGRTQPGVQFRNCQFEGRVVFSELSFDSPPRFEKCAFEDDLYVEIESRSGSFEIDSCLLGEAVIVRAPGSSSVKMRGNFSDHNRVVDLSGLNVERIEFHGNRLPVSTTSFSRVEAGLMSLNANVLGNVVFENVQISRELDIRKTKVVGKVALAETYFSGGAADDIDWMSFDSLRLAFLESYESGYDYYKSDRTIYRGMEDKEAIEDAFQISLDPRLDVVSGANEADLDDKEYFSRLMALYSMFVNLYKGRNDMDSYNQSFVAMKELQLKRLERLYQANPGFAAYFRWKLAVLLKYYVNHGTDPARAILASFYIIFWFAVFYFFFPSEWDPTSKRKLIENYRDFIQKNEKGYVKPLLILVARFLRSFVNALTLSLNAFITLGFGNIPTSGAARYMCVVEGFVGWFLLSIFTVALINQVL